MGEQFTPDQEFAAALGAIENTHYPHVQRLGIAVSLIETLHVRLQVAEALLQRLATPHQILEAETEVRQRWED